MKKGSIINLHQLPKLIIEDQNGKVRNFQLAGIVIQSHNNYQGDLSAHSVLRKYLYQPIQYQITKGTFKGKVKLTNEAKGLAEILLQTSVATFNQEQAVLSNLYTAEEINTLKQIKIASKPSILNGVKDIGIVNKSQVAKIGKFDLVQLSQNLIIAKDNYYFTANLKNIELYCSEHDSEIAQNFMKKHPTIQVTQLKFFYSLSSKSHVAQIVCDPEFQLALITEGFGKLSLKGATHLPKQTYQKAIQLEQEAKSNYKGLWKNYLDIYSLIYVKNNFLGKVIEVVEGHIYRVQNMVTNKILIVELSTIVCPIGQQHGAFEARQYARKQIIGKLVNVYIKKETAYSIQAMLVRLQDHESLDKILLSEGWGTIKQDSINQSQTTRLKDLGAKAVDNKLGLFNSSKNKIGIIRFQQLTTLNTKQTIERARQFAQGLKNKYSLNSKQQNLTGVIEGFKNNDILKVRLNSKKAIINVKLQGVKALDTKLVVKQYKTFKQNSLSYLQQNYLQRDIQVRIIEFDQKIESFIGEVLINETNIVQTLLSQGLVYIDKSWYIPSVFNEREEQAKNAQKGLWSQTLLKLKKQDSKKQKQSFFLATICQLKEGNIIFYQTKESQNKLQTIIAPVLKNDLLQLPKQQIKIGNICAAPFQGQLYRAKITSFKKKNNNLVQVEYIDYGNRAQVNKSDLLAIPEQLMVIEQLCSSGTLLFLKKLKQSNQNYQGILDEIQGMLIQRQFNFHIIQDEILLFDSTSKQGCDIFKSINTKILQNGLLKLDHKRLYKIDQNISKELNKIEDNVRIHKLGSWGAYESDSQIEDDLELHISGEKMLQPSSKKKA